MYLNKIYYILQNTNIQIIDYCSFFWITLKKIYNGIYEAGIFENYFGSCKLKFKI